MRARLNAAAAGILLAVVLAPSVLAGHTPVTICHHAGPNPVNWHTITVDDDSVTLQAHLGHGDTLGPCTDTTTPTPTPTPASSASTPTPTPTDDPTAEPSATPTSTSTPQGSARPTPAAVGLPGSTLPPTDTATTTDNRPASLGLAVILVIAVFTTGWLLGAQRIRNRKKGE